MIVLDLSVLIAGVAGLWVVNRALARRILKRKLHNRLLAVASEEFFESAEKLMKTPDELPDPVLDMLSMMSRTGMSPGSERVFLDALKRSRQGQTKDAASRKMSDAIGSMRKELQDIFRDAACAWFNVMTHKSTLYYQKIATEEMQAQAQRIKPKDQAMRTLSSMKTSFC